MSTGTFMTIIAAWVLAGIAMSVVLGRRGHDGISWLIVGILLGPLSALLAVDVVRHDEALAVEPVKVGTPPPRSEGIRVLVGYDDSPDAHAVIEAVIGLMGQRLQSLTLARVLPFDGGTDEEDDARAGLLAEAKEHVDTPIELEIIRGRPASALVEAAVVGRFDLLAVGAVGAAHSVLYGSTTHPLSRQRTVPVLICAARSR